jgi:hypothetical protein
MTTDTLRLDRRNLLSTTAGVGAGAAGCLDQDRQQGGVETRKREPSQQQTPSDQLSSTGRIGDAVFYDPDGDGPYEDGQAALADVPPGGTFVIGHGTWDVAEEGRLLVQKSVNVRGMGWTSNREAKTGTIIDNTGDDAVDEPAVEFHGPEDLSDNGPRITGGMSELRVDHAGDAPAVRFVRTIRNHIADCSVHCHGAPIGIKYDTWSFFARAYRNRVKSATDICVHVTGNGYAHEFYSNHIVTSVDGATAFQTERNRTIVVGGECAATGENGTAIRFKGCRGGYVVEPGIEHTDVGIELGTTDAQASLIQVYHLGQKLFGNNVACRFHNAKGCVIVHPVMLNNNMGRLAEWKEESSNCGIITNVEPLTNQNYTDEGARNPWVSVQGAATEAQVERIPTGVPTTVDYVVEDRSPAFHHGDDTGWQSLGDTMTPLFD